MKNHMDYHRQREHARGFVHSRLEVFNEHYCFVYNRVAIRNQRTRWGSCSKKGNLNFNYRIASLPIHLADYVIVHELCHLEEFNHSQKFWSLVARAIPDHRARRMELRAIHIGLRS
ncbi:MAG: M48 family metallopeptidase [Patescibacteria group bacterium]